MSYSVEWIPGGIFLGIVLLPLIVPAFAMLGLVAVVIAALWALAALAAAILAIPYVLGGTVRRHRAEGHHRPVKASAPIAAPIGRTATAMHH